jgi:hypothetical protein
MQATSDYKNQHLFQELIRCVIMIVGVMKKKEWTQHYAFKHIICISLEMEE